MSNANNDEKKFSSKKTIIAVAIFILAAGTGIAASISTRNSLEQQLSMPEESLSVVTDYETKEAAKDVTGVTEKNTIPTTTEKIIVVKTEDYVLPAGKEIVKDYSNFVAVKSETMDDWRVHNGVDFKAEVGDEIKAIRSGAVLAIYNSSLWGTIIEIDHGAGVTGRYCGLDEKCNVTVNDVVEQGQVIGKIGEIPVEKAEGPHLHLEIMQDGRITDPVELFTAQ